MKHLSTLLLTGALAMTTSLVADAQQLAFPGAQGWGRFAQGGRSGEVYHVTNLNDSGSGSLRDAVSKSNRIIVFDVAGVINISSRIVFSNNLYVAGQTAPGEGITVYGNGVSFSGASNIICRYMRFRMGAGGDSGKDCAGVANGTNMIFDHCSFAWGRDETFSISSDGKGDLGDITLQNCVVGQGLLTHSAGGLMQADHITLYRNFYCDNSTRNNKVKGTNQYANNVVYNWKNGGYLMGGDSSGESFVNAQNSLFINGPAGGGNAFTEGNSLFHIYADGNYQDKNRDGKLDPYLIPLSEYTGGVDHQTAPFAYPTLELWGATQLVDSLLPNVGASLPYRDYVDHYMVNECMSFGKEGVLISNESTLPFGKPSTWTVWQGTKRVDSDGDGMPDAWETANGTDPNKNDAMVKAANGYVNIENYINSITEESIEFFLRQPMMLSLAESTPSSLTLNWADYTRGEQGFIVEMEIDGAYVEVGRVEKDVTSFTIAQGLAEGTGYNVRVCAYKDDMKSVYVSGNFKTQPKQVEMVDVENYQPDYSWKGGNGAWDFTSENWISGLYTDASKVLFAPETADTVTISETVAPASVVVKGAGNLVMEGSGKISGEGTSLNKAGEGTLKLATTNDYTGATVLRGGVVEFATLKNGGEASAIGASLEFAQNWVWYGGSWNYTGGSTSSNRSATIYKDTELNIAQSGATVKMSGTLEGNGGFILNGSGTLQPTTKAFFGYEGNTVLRGGTLYLTKASELWTDKNVKFGNSPKLVLAGGALVTKDNNDTYSSYTFPIEAVSGTHSVLNFHRNCSIASNVTGDGTIELQVNYLREYIKGNWTGFTGKLIGNGVNTKSGECQMMFENGPDLSNCTIVLKGNIQIVCWKASATGKLGGLSGAAGTYLSGFSKNTTSSKGTWIVGGANTDETFHGVIDNRCSASGKNGTVNIQKEGKGIWRLTGTNVYSGSTVVNGGRLVVNGKNNGAGAVTVNEEAVLAGEGMVAGAVTIKSGAMLYAGDTIPQGKTFTLSKGLTVEAGGAVCIPLYRTGTLNKANKLALKGTVSLKEGAVLKLDLGYVTTEFKTNSSFTVLDLASSPTISGTFTTVEPAVPAEDMEWDLSELYTSGKIYVREKGYSGIESIDGEPETVRTALYDLCGNEVSDEAAHGILICKTWANDGSVKVKRIYKQ